MDQATAIKVTGDVYLTNLVIIALSGLWIYDWFLTLGDEINHAWSGRKSWVFLLYLANRYLPWVLVIWEIFIIFGSGDLNNICRRTGWLPLVHATFIAFPTQMTIALRVYAVTGRDRWLCSPLFLLIFLQTVGSATETAIHMTMPDPKLPTEILELFRICVHMQWKPGATAYSAVALAFDTCAFLILLVGARRDLPPRSWGITTLLGVIVRDGTIYFVVIFSIQFCSLVSPFITTQAIQVLPGVANIIISPIMAARLMISLKKAAAAPAQSWSFESTSGVSRTRDIELRFMP